ncbi:hypothetical protein COO60DRAFT_1548165 [Scenedesmus sp. NREL 46B-D3]|nr:hypothetical protein COO60DRAFT_1548165 [Scenedesmus sp. NREL 46B-D3]
MPFMAPPRYRYASSARHHAMQQCTSHKQRLNDAVPPNPSEATQPLGSRSRPHSEHMCTNACNRSNDRAAATTLLCQHAPQQVRPHLLLLSLLQVPCNTSMLQLYMQQVLLRALVAACCMHYRACTHHMRKKSGESSTEHPSFDLAGTSNRQTLPWYAPHAAAQRNAALPHEHNNSNTLKKQGLQLQGPSDPGSSAAAVCPTPPPLIYLYSSLIVNTQCTAALLDSTMCISGEAKTCSLM